MIEPTHPALQCAAAALGRAPRPHDQETPEESAILATTEVVRYGLVAAAEQMAATLGRSARSQVIREVLDYSTAVFDLSGGIVAQSTRIPIHLNSMTRVLQTILGTHHPAEEWGDGDVFLTNDPYSGGQHLPDLMAFAPVEVEGELVAICGTCAHHLDVGGRGPGSYGADATDIYQEGFRIPPCRVRHSGEVDQMLLHLLAANIRVPQKTLGDLQAQIASLDIGAEEVRRLVARYGTATFRGSLAAVVEASEQRMRAVIEDIPDGVYEARDVVDGDGLEAGPIPIELAVTVSGSVMKFDLTGTAEQVPGPINCPLAATESALFFAVLAMLDPDASANWGCYRPLEVVAPEGSVVNPRMPAAVVGRNVVAHRVTNVAMSALSDALPDRAIADYYGNSNVYIIAFRDQVGGSNILFDIDVGGWGASTERDGHDCLSAGTHNLMNTPVEISEQEFPLRVASYELRADSGGPGRHRGGMGVRRVIEVLSDAGFSAQFDRVLHPPRGREGGGPGAPARLTVEQHGERRNLPGKVLAHRLEPGDRVILESQGGGGFGPPGERPAASLRRDIHEGRVSPEAWGSCP